MQSARSHAAILRDHRRWDADPAVDLAVEETLLRPGSSPAVFAYGWSAGAVVLGRGQPVTDIDLDAARDHGLAVARRSSGGTAVVHRGDLSVSLVLPATHPWAVTIAGLYDRFLEVVADTLAAMDVSNLDRPAALKARPRSPICFEGNAGETLAIEGRKVVGCAQARRREAVLVHGMFVLDVDPDLSAAVFRTPTDRIRQVIGALPRSVGPREHLADRLVQALSQALDLPAAPFAPPDPLPEAAARLKDLHWVPVPFADAVSRPSPRPI